MTVIEKAKRTLKANIVHTVDGPMVAAGGGHFRSLWVRDFCHSVPGLLASGGYEEVVRNQLVKIYSVRSSDGWLPRGLDVVNPKVRVIWNLFVSRSPSFMSYEKKPLVAEYLGEHKTPAYDSNLLFILAAKQFERHAHTRLFSNEQLRELLKVYKLSHEGLLHQPAFSDWQDSARREGPILLTHLLYLKVLIELELSSEAKKLARAVNATFIRKGRYYERPHGEQISLDSQLFILNNRLPLEAVDFESMYSQLKSSMLWRIKDVPGVPIHPPYESKEISWTQKVTGVQNYHDGFVWGWLTAEAVKCAKLYKDHAEAQRITDEFCASTEKDEFLSEIYSEATGILRPARTTFYKSESPFSWTAAKWAEALHA